MPSKEDYCYRILNTYSLIVDFDGIPTRCKVPGPVEEETYGQWKKRVLGENVKNIVLYVPSDPPNQTKIRTLQNQAGADHLKKVFLAFGKTKKEQKEIAISAAKTKIEKQFTTFSRDTLEDLISEQNAVLEPSVKEFINRFFNADADIDAEKLISELLMAYNAAVRIYHEAG